MHFSNPTGRCLCLLDRPSVGAEMRTTEVAIVTRVAWRARGSLHRYAVLKFERQASICAASDVVHVVDIRGRKNSWNILETNAERQFICWYKWDHGAVAADNVIEETRAVLVHGRRWWSGGRHSEQLDNGSGCLKSAVKVRVVRHSLYKFQMADPRDASSVKLEKKEFSGGHQTYVPFRDTATKFDRRESDGNTTCRFASLSIVRCTKPKFVVVHEHAPMLDIGIGAASTVQRARSVVHGA